MAADYVFVLHVKGPKTDATYPLAVGSYLIGSAPECDIPLLHAFVSQQHARLDCTAAACTLTDLDSTNGTYIDGKQLTAGEPTALGSHLRAEISSFELFIRPVATEEAQPAEREADDSATAEPTPADDEAQDDSPIARHITSSIGQNGGVGLPVVTLAGDSDDFPRSLQQVGLEQRYSRYMQYLPALYNVPFIHSFLALFESLLAPIEWRVDNLELYLDPRTTPAEFLPWLAQWYAISFDYTWDETRRRQLLTKAPQIFAHWGTAYALSQVLEIYLGQPPIIRDDESLPPFTFNVHIPLPVTAVDRAALEELVDAHKPAFTSYQLTFEENKV
jgi:phage tail-like protein